MPTADLPTFPDEDELPDDYPVYGGYLYVADGEVYRSDWHCITVRELKARTGFKEIRCCNIAARRAAIDAEVAS
jgi:hypothetical protein